MRNHHSQGFQRWGCCKEFCGLVGVEFFGDPPAADDWATPVAFIDIHPPALERGFACAPLALGDWDNIPDFPAIHEAQLLLACRTGESCWEWLIRDGVPVGCGMLRQAGLFVLHTRLFCLRLDARRMLKGSLACRGETRNASFQFRTVGRECSRNLLRGHCVGRRFVSPAQPRRYCTRKPRLCSRLLRRELWLHRVAV